MRLAYIAFFPKGYKNFLARSAIAEKIFHPLTYESYEIRAEAQGRRSLP